MADQRLDAFAQTFSNISFGKNWASYSDIQKGKNYTDVLEALKSDAFVCGPEGVQNGSSDPVMELEGLYGNEMELFVSPLGQRLTLYVSDGNRYEKGYTMDTYPATEDWVKDANRLMEQADIDCRIYGFSREDGETCYSLLSSEQAELIQAQMEHNPDLAEGLSFRAFAPETSSEQLPSLGDALQELGEEQGQVL